MLERLDSKGLTVVLTAVVLGVVVLESVALLTGHNGLMFGVSMAILGAVVGLPVGTFLKK